MCCEHQDVRLATSLALGKATGQEEDSATLALLGALKNGSADVRAASAEGLSQKYSRAHEVVPLLIDSLNDKDWRVRDSAAVALGNFGGLEEVGGPLRAILEHDSVATVRQAAAEALSVGTGESISSLLFAIEHDKSPEVRASAIENLSGLYLRKQQEKAYRYEELAKIPMVRTVVL